MMFDINKARTLINTEHPGPWDEWMRAACDRVQELEREVERLRAKHESLQVDHNLLRARLTVACDAYENERDELLEANRRVMLERYDSSMQRDAARAEAERMRPVYEAAVALAPKLEPTGDWACELCRPNSDMLQINPGFRCRVHALTDAISTALSSTGGGK